MSLSHIARSSRLWAKHRGIWLEDILEDQTAEVDLCRLCWKVPSPDNRLPYTALLLFTSHKEGVIVKGNNFCIALTEQQQRPGNYGVNSTSSCGIRYIERYLACWKLWVHESLVWKDKGLFSASILGYCGLCLPSDCKVYYVLYLGRTKPVTARIYGGG